MSAMTSDHRTTTLATFLDEVRGAAERAGVFGVVECHGEMLRASAPKAAAEAWYRLRRGHSAGDGAAWHVEFVTPDRWLSESIEADLMHHGDPIEELVEEELIERSAEARGTRRERAASARPIVQHFRSDDLLYTFRTPLAGDPPDAAEATRYLLAYEAAFRELGDVEADPDE